MSKIWITAFAAAQKRAIPELLLPSTAGKTNHTAFKSGLGGSGYRFVLGERYGSRPVTYGKVMAKISGQLATLTFEGKEEVIINPGEAVYSDPVEQTVSQGDLVELWLYNAGENTSQSACRLVQTHSFAGCYAGEEFEAEVTPLRIPPQIDLQIPENYPEQQTGFCELQVLTDEKEDCGNIVAFGDSITEMNFWAKPLKEEIEGRMPNRTLLNMGIGGNRLLRDSHMPYAPQVQLFGYAGLKRLDWDALNIAGVKVMLLALGINDLAQPGGAPASFNPSIEELPTAEELIEGYRTVISRAHEAGICVAGCTLTPFAGFPVHDSRREAIRQVINDWMLTSGEFDMTIDFASAICEENDSTRIKPQLQIGDCLHPNEAGGAKMAACVDMDKLIALSRKKI